MGGVDWSQDHDLAGSQKHRSELRKEGAHKFRLCRLTAQTHLSVQEHVEVAVVVGPEHDDGDDGGAEELRLNFGACAPFGGLGRR